MENTKNNIPAFPRVAFDEQGTITSDFPEYNGMNLLDYHASKFMQVYLAEHLKALSENRNSFTVSDMVESSYIIAKEMLKQREL